MEWLWIILVAYAAYAAWQWMRKPKPPAGPQATRIGMNMASDRELMLATFRRELANYLVRRDPDRYVDLYRRAMQAEAAMGKADPEEREAYLTVITKRYPFYTDFDFIGTRPYVLYADALGRHADEELEEHYLNLVKFQALMRVADPDWKFYAAATSEKELEHLIGYVRKLKDTRFRHRLAEAVELFYANSTTNRLTGGTARSPTRTPNLRSTMSRTSRKTATAFTSRTPTSLASMGHSMRMTAIKPTRASIVPTSASKPRIPSTISTSTNESESAPAKAARTQRRTSSTYRGGKGAFRRSDPLHRPAVARAGATPA